MRPNSWARLAMSATMAMALLIPVGCEKKVPVPKRKDRVDGDLVYPLRRGLMNESGTVIEADILGRSEDSIMFVRKDNGKGYTLPIDQLYHADQARMRRLPIRPHVFETPLTRQQKATVRAIEFKKEEIARLKRSVDELELAREFDGRSVNNAEIARLRNKIGSLQREILRLEESMGAR